MKKTILIIITILSFTITYSQKAYELTTYKGSIGKYKIVMEIVQDDYFSGDYFYLTQNKKINFSSEEIVGNGKVILYEMVNNIKTGFFVFKNIDFKKNILKGQWFSIDGSKSYKVILNKINL